MNERIAYATLVGLVAYASVATDLYLPALPAIVEAFGATEGDGQLTLSLFLVGLATGQLLFGPLSDFYGRLPVVIAGTVLFMAMSIVCALAVSIEMMWVARFVQGFTAASGPVIARAIVRDCYAGSRAAQIMSMLNASMAVVPLIAPTIGAWLLVLISWQATYIALAVFAALVLLGLRNFEESAPAIGEGSPDITRVLGQFSKCLSNRQFIGYQICGVSGYAAIFAYLSTVSYFMRDVFLVPPEYFGFAFAVSVAGFMIGALVCSRLVLRLGTNQTLRLGILMTLTAATSQWILVSAGNTSAVLLASLSFTLFLGIGLSAANASMGAISLFPKQAGSASAVYGFIHAVSAATAGYFAGQLYDGTLVPTAAVMLTCSAVGAIAVPLIRGPASNDQPPELSPPKGT